MAEVVKKEQINEEEESKLDDFDGYREYRRTINPDKLIGLTYNFDIMKFAIDTLFK